MPAPPSDAAPVLTAGGTFTQAWRAFFAALSGNAAGEAVIVKSEGSPFTYTAPSAGVFALGAAVIDLSLIRGRTTVPLIAGASLIPMAGGDRLLITYGKTPPMTFLPS